MQKTIIKPIIMYLIFVVVILSVHHKDAYAKTSSSHIKKAQYWIRIGTEALNQKNYTKALNAYEKAERHHSSVKHLMLIAHVHSLQKNNCRRAIHLWKEALLRTDSEKYQLKIQKKIKEQESTCTRQVYITSNPAGAKLWVDQELVGLSPMTFEVDHEIKQISATFQGEHLNQAIRKELNHKETVSFTFNPKIKTPKVSSHKAPMVIHTSIECRALLEDKSYTHLNSCTDRVLWEDDQFKLNLSVEQDSYIYVLLSNERGQHQMIFPHHKANNLLSANQKVTLPTKGWFTLDEIGPVHERITVIYARQPVGELEQSRGLNQVPTPAKQIRQFAMRGIKQINTLSSFESKDNQKTLRNRFRFTGMDEINRLHFTLDHGGSRPLLEE